MVKQVTKVWINDVVIWILVIFMCIGALDKIFGNKFGYGEAFEQGFQSMGPLMLAMAGIISISPVLANVLRPIITPLFTAMGADPAMFAGILLAIDMGGYSLSMELAQSYEAAIFSGIIMSTLIGPTFVFTVPVALSLIKKEDEAILAKGILIGLIPIPIGAFIGGVVSGFPITFILLQLIPLLIFSIFIGIGLVFFQQQMTKGFVLFGKGIVAFITICLAISIVEFLTGVVIIPGMTPLSEGIHIVGIIGITLAGAFPFVEFLKKILGKVLPPLGNKLNTSPYTFVGLISSLAHSIPMFKMLEKMDEKGKLMNVAFAVSGAFVLGGHLGFTASVESSFIFPMMLAKLISGIISVFLAYFIGKYMFASK